MTTRPGARGQSRSAVAVLLPRGGQILMLLSLPALGYLLLRTVSTTGADWSSVGRSVVAVELLWLPAMTFLWWAGHCARASAMVACLPGLSLRQALSLCFAGSAVANSLPLGGALSYGVTAAMIRSWGFTPRALAAFFTLNQVCNILVRLVFGVLSLGWFLLWGPGAMQGSPALLLSVVVAVSLLGACTLLASDQVMVWAGRHTGWALIAVRGEALVCLRRSWPRLLLGAAGYMLLLGALLALCLRGLGAPQPVLLSVAVVGIERMVTAVPLTPGGAGAAELTIFTGLTAAGATAGDALAAALLYRFFTFLLEIPVGAVIILLWRVGRRRATRPPAGEVTPVPPVVGVTGLTVALDA
jgi:putative heme transporter